MKLIADGVLHGKTLELEEETGLPEGLRVRVILETGELSPDQKRREAEALCGAWSADDSIEEIFIAIERNRQLALPRSDEPFPKL
ncbi:MAG: hypothetical protein NTW86_01950 [Candidatus Sumerlaeota bacterium]|nr:hypothetical protein [Candidatus Sumerlaeota bacterium]